MVSSASHQRADVPSPWDVLLIGFGTDAAALAQCSVDGAMVHRAHSRSIIWYMRLVQMLIPRDTNSLSARDAINISSRWAEPILDAHTAKTKIDAAWSLWDQPVCLNARSSLPRRFQSVGRNIAMTRNDVISSSIKEILSFDATDVQLGKCGCTGWPREGYSSQYSRPKRPTRRPMLMIIEN